MDSLAFWEKMLLYYMFAVAGLILFLLLFITIKERSNFLVQRKLKGNIQWRCWFSIKGIPGYKGPLEIRASYEYKYEELATLVYDRFGGNLHRQHVRDLISCIMLEQVWKRFPQIDQILENQYWEFDFERDFIQHLGEWAKDRQEFDKLYKEYWRRKIYKSYPTSK